ncbi:MAG TPA: tryptophan-rich sensory protein [Chlamydiales bacterium]|nr:tryptophan-rich sensory protein [Chlamydiales bacterium]
MTISLFWIKPSHRSWAEQAIGGAIFLLLSFTVKWAARFFMTAPRVQEFFSSHWALSMAISNPPWIAYHFLIAGAMWILWRRYSLRVLSLELAIFLCALFLEIGWSLSFYCDEPLFALATLVFLCSSAILGALLYWKKERFSGQAFLLSFLWIFYVMSTNMSICMR